MQIVHMNTAFERYLCALRGVRDGFHIAGGMDPDYASHLMGLDWVLGVRMKITNVFVCSGARGDDSDRSVHVPRLI